MTVTERLMKPGQFSLKLKDNAPYSKWSAVQEFDHIVITPVRVNPNALADSQILGAAIYTGVVTGKPSPTDIQGQGLAYWMGTDDGLGDVLDGTVSNSAAVLSTWVNSLRPVSIGAGTVTSPASTLAHTFQWCTRREALDYVCRLLGAEWRINPNCTLDAAITANLFVTTPTAVITRRGEGRDGGFAGIEATNIDQARDVTGYTTKVVCVGQKGDGSQVATGSATQSTSYKDFNNNAVIMERLANAPDTAAANTSAAAAGALAYYGLVRRTLNISSRTYAVPVKVKPGDYVYIFDQRADLYDTANQITWRGRLIQPIKLRCKEYTWPIARGMGIYARRSGATPVYTDLTDYIEYETGDTTWQIGASDGDPEQDPSQLSSAYLGINPTVIGRVVDPPLTSWTPTLTNVTLGTSTMTATYRYIGGGLLFTITISAGTATATAGGDIRFTMPAGFTQSAAIQPVTGLLASSTVVSARSDAGTIRMWKTAAAANFIAADSIASTTISGFILCA